jgi:hypothetical protein
MQKVENIILTVMEDPEFGDGNWENELGLQ